MIARIWRGWAAPDKAPEYEKLFAEVILPRVTQGVDGYLRTNLLKEKFRVKWNSLPSSGLSPWKRLNDLQVITSAARSCLPKSGKS